METEVDGVVLWKKSKEKRCIELVYIHLWMPVVKTVVYYGFISCVNQYSKVS